MLDGGEALQEIAELLARIGEVVARDRVGHLIGFLERVRRNGRGRRAWVAMGQKQEAAI
jgi:hypothetical protein